MLRTAQELVEDALRIWEAGVAGAHPERLMPAFVHVDGGELWIDGQAMPFASLGRIAVVGAGKAAGAMARALEKALGEDVLRRHVLESWVNVVDSDAAAGHIYLHPSRPRGTNEPTEEAAAGVHQMLRIVKSLGPDDLCICLLSGGASALMPAPTGGISVAEKSALTRALSAAGASIEQLNAVRRELSLIKGGGLARACKAGRLVSLVLSDVPGDDLATIASGPTVVGPSSPELAIQVLDELKLSETEIGRRAIAVLKSPAAEPDLPTGKPSAEVRNVIIGNNATAVDAAGVEAERLGYSHAMISAAGPEGSAEDVAQRLVGMGRRMREQPGPDCLISGGEPTVTLAPEPMRGKGGRNQQLCLAAMALLSDWSDMALVAGGTDGEDGPTDAAGAYVDAESWDAARRLGLDVDDYLARNDAYSFFDQLNSLLRPGATHTNVADLRVLAVNRPDA